MSECNYCSLNKIKARTKIFPHMKVTIIQKDGWNNVYAHPKSITRPDIHGDRYLVSMMKEIPDHCCC